jgi:hypothetical protein
VDTQGIDIIRGEIHVQGPIHGGAAINSLVFLYADPNDWEMKQFVSQLQLEQYAKEHMLLIRRKD